MKNKREYIEQNSGDKMAIDLKMQLIKTQYLILDVYGGPFLLLSCRKQKTYPSPFQNERSKIRLKASILIT